MRAELFILPEVGQIHLPSDAVQQSLVHDGSGHWYHCQPGQTHMYVVRKQPQRLRNVFIEQEMLKHRGCGLPTQIAPVRQESKLLIVRRRVRKRFPYEENNGRTAALLLPGLVRVMSGFTQINGKHNAVNRISVIFFYPDADTIETLIDFLAGCGNPLHCCSLIFGAYNENAQLSPRRMFCIFQAQLPLVGRALAVFRSPVSRAFLIEVCCLLRKWARMLLLLNNQSQHIYSRFVPALQA